MPLCYNGFMQTNLEQKGGERVMGVFKKRIPDPNGPISGKDGKRYRLDECWWIDYYVNGRRRFERVSPSKRMAQDRLGKVKAELREGRFFDKKRQPPRIRFDEFAKLYLENHCNITRRHYERTRICINRLLEHFAEKYLNEITPWLVEKYRMERLKRVKPGTMYQEIACLKSMFNRAKEWGKLLENPIRSVKNPRVKNERLRYLTKDEIDRLLNACRSLDPRAEHLYPIVLMALHTGMRRGEILNLKWSGVDLENKQIVLTDTKNKETRVIPLTNTLAETLREIRREGDTYVFQNADGKPFRDVKRSFHTALKRAGISDFRFHDLRHTAASHMVMAGVDIFTVQEILGHKSIEMTRRYSHLSPRHKRVAVEALENTLGNNIGNEMDTKTDTKGVFPKFDTLEKSHNPLKIKEMCP